MTANRRIIILLLSSKNDLHVLEMYNKLLEECSAYADVCLLHDQQKYNFGKNTEQNNINVFAFDHTVLSLLPYTPYGDRIVPGNTYFPLMKFWKEHPQYDYYWIVEDDVMFTGNWAVFFETFSNDKSDFISSYIRSYEDEPNWAWWSTIHSYKENENLNKNDLFASFNPIYRLSSKALICLDSELRKGWIGHYEGLIPTILIKNHMAVRDIGGSGRYVQKGEKKIFYTESSYSYAPLKIQDFVPNLLYHPIKEKKIKKDYKHNCVISAVGKNSLHKLWNYGTNERTWDLHLIVFDLVFPSYYEDADFMYYKKGYKLRLIYDYIKNHPHILDAYDYFFFPDDDIYTNASNIEKLFENMKLYSLEIAQPSLINSYYTYFHTLKKEYTKIRYTNFIEMMLPCFSRTALKKVLYSFNENESGWGIEYHWAELIDSNGMDMAILDDVPMKHTRPIKQERFQNQKEMIDYMNKYALCYKAFETGYILKDNLLNRSIARNQYIGNIECLHNLYTYVLRYFDNSQNICFGIDRICIFCLLSCEYSKITEDVNGIDIAFKYIECMSEKNNLSHLDTLSIYVTMLIVQKCDRNFFFEGNIHEELIECLENLVLNKEITEKDFVQLYTFTEQLKYIYKDDYEHYISTLRQFELFGNTNLQDLFLQLNKSDNTNIILYSSNALLTYIVNANYTPTERYIYELLKMCRLMINIQQQILYA